MQTKSTRIIVTVLGHDRVGIIAAVADILADAGANIWTSPRPSCGRSSR